VSIARHIAASSPPGTLPELGLGSDDVQAAYRVLPSSQPGLTVAALWCPHPDGDWARGHVGYVTLPGHPFGLAGAPLSWNRLSLFLTCVSRRLFGVCAGVYYDDMVVVEPLYCSAPGPRRSRPQCFSKRKASGQAALDLVFSTVGLGLDIGKHKEVAVTNIFLGLEFNFSDFAAKDLIYVGVSQRRRDTLGLTLDKVLAEDYLTSGNAASLCGKLRFTLSPLFSRIGKAALSSTQAWGSSSKPSVSDVLPAPVREAISFLRDLLPSLPAAVVQARATLQVPTIVLTDAMYQRGSSRPAGLGAVYSFPESTGIVPRRIFTFGEADAAFLAALANFGERATYISQLEVLAVLAAISGEAGERLRGQVVHFYIDSQSALSGLHKGYSGCLDMAHLINAFWLRALELRITPWFSYVPSKSNLADLPSRSREALGPLLDAGFVETEMTVPPFPALGIKRGSKRAAASDPTSASPSRDSAPRLL